MESQCTRCGAWVEEDCTCVEQDRLYYRELVKATLQEFLSNPNLYSDLKIEKCVVICCQIADAVLEEIKRRESD